MVCHAVLSLLSGGAYGYSLFLSSGDFVAIALCFVRERYHKMALNILIGVNEPLAQRSHEQPLQRRWVFWCSSYKKF